MNDGLHPTGLEAPPRAAGGSATGFFDDVAVFADCYNRSSFTFRHGLKGNALFELPSLIGLARRHPEDAEHAYWSNGDVDIADRWDKNRAARHGLVETISGIASNNSLVLLRHVEQDAVLGPLVQRLLSDVVRLSGEKMRRDIIIGRATILLASPHRVTAYHIDADCNHLLQVAGTKTLSVFDQSDRSLLTLEELERYSCGDFNGATFKSGRQGEAFVYALGPGLGVHIPCTAPHWARNDGAVSVALSLNFDLCSGERQMQVHRFNRRLRRLGIQPAAPGMSTWRDWLKRGSVSSFEYLRKRGAGLVAGARQDA